MQAAMQQVSHIFFILSYSRRNLVDVNFELCAVKLCGAIGGSGRATVSALITSSWLGCVPNCSTKLYNLSTVKCRIERRLARTLLAAILCYMTLFKGFHSDENSVSKWNLFYFFLFGIQCFFCSWSLVLLCLQCCLIWVLLKIKVLFSFYLVFDMINLLINIIRLGVKYIKLVFLLTHIFCSKLLVVVKSFLICFLMSNNMF